MTLLEWLYDSLTRNDPPRPADLIFVLAGKIERKQYGMELYRAGSAPRLLLSIGRFEVSKMLPLNFEFTAELIAHRDRTAPHERHFFCDIDASGTRISTRRLRRWSTYGEALALRDYLPTVAPVRIMVVSTDIHLRRVAATFDHVFRGRAVEFQYRPVPESDSSLRQPRWWSRPADRRYVVSEAAKLVGYRLILLMPEFMIRRLMRLK